MESSDSKPDQKDSGITEPRQPDLSRQEFSINGWRFFFQFSLAVILFLAIESLYQYYAGDASSFQRALIKGSALTGGTLIALSLFSSAIFKWYPATARYWLIRRYLGVAGALVITIHALGILFVAFSGDVLTLLSPFDLLKNPNIFGVFAFLILLAMAITSTNWAMKKMGGRNWKFLHRFVYVAFPAAIFHYALFNPTIHETVPGFILVTTTALAVFGQLFWFFKTIKSRRYRNAGTYVGGLIIIAAIVVAYLLYCA